MDNIYYPTDDNLPTDVVATSHSTPLTQFALNELRPLPVPTHLALPVSPISPSSPTPSLMDPPSHPPSSQSQPSPLSASLLLQQRSEQADQEAFIEGGNCGGCKRFVGPQQVAPGTLITFGDSLFHLDCFRCVKCKNRVTEDTNLLLLADGSPVCTDCSYQCYVCKELIMDEAIMTGDEAYHAACFTCKHCKCTIEELVFAKTSQGIYCMSCHNKRVAKSRKHAEAKRKRDRKEREKERLQEKQVQQDLQNDLDGSRAHPEIALPEGQNSSLRSTSPYTRPSRSIEDTQAPAPHLIPRSPSLSPSPSMSSSLVASGKYREVDDSTQPRPLLLNTHFELSSAMEAPVQKSDSPGSLSLESPEHPSSRYLTARRGSEDSRSESFTKDGAAFGLGLGVGPIAGSTSRSEKRRSINPATFPVEAATSINSPLSPYVNQSTSPFVSGPLNQPASTGSPSLGLNSNVSSDGRPAGLPPSPLRSSYLDASLPDLQPSPPVSPNGQASSRLLRPVTPDRSQSTSATASSPYSITPLAISMRRSRSREGSDLSSTPTTALSKTPPRKSSLNDHRVRTTEDSPGRKGDSLSAPKSPNGRSLSPSSAAGERMEGRSGSLTFPLVEEDDEISQPSGQSIQPINLFRARSPLKQSTAPPHVVVVDDGDTSRETKQMNIQAHVHQDLNYPPSLNVDSLPERRSSVSQDPPKLESPRPVSFLLSNDPEFAMLFKTVGETGVEDGPMIASESINQGGMISTLSNGIPIEFQPLEEFQSDEEDDDDEADEDEDEDEGCVDVDAYVNAEDEEKEQDDVASELPSRVSAESVYDSKSNLAAVSSISSPMPTSSSTSFSRHGRRDGDPSSSSQHEDGGPAAVLRRLLTEAKKAGKGSVEVELEPLEGVLDELRSSVEKFVALKSNYDGVKRASAQYIHGLTVQSEDFEKEVQTRQEVEAEVKRLRAQMHGQTARLSLLDADQKRQDAIARRSRELTENMVGLEKDISRLRAERDLALAEVEELSTSSRTNLLLEANLNSAGPSASLSRSLSVRLDSVKENYRKELEPLNVEREKLSREVTELKESREFYLAESTTLHARNEELSDLHVTLVRQIEQAQETLNKPIVPPPSPAPPQQQQQHPLTPTSEQAGYFSANGTPKGTKAGMYLPRFNNHHRDHQQHVSGSSSVSSLPGFTSVDGQEEIAKYVKVVKPEVAMDSAPVAAVAASSKKFKWYKSSSSSSSSASKAPEAVNSAHASSTSISSARIINMPTVPAVTSRIGTPQLKTRPSYEGKSTKDHHLQSHSIPTLRFTRCDHCGDKMWGPITELRCNLCGFNCHSKCVAHLVASCPSSSALPSLDEAVPGLATAPSQPSMFGRSLQDQIQADGDVVPFIVSKCIAAVEDNGMEYEGIYRKTGGSSQSKHITQLFERGDYDSFDLNDQDTFNDISSITSVLKNYFRGLPDPLLTFELHEKFVSASMIRDPEAKKEQLSALVHQLPKPHFETLKYLMLHLNRVMALQSINLMSAKNLGVVFGPTLMRSADRSREFGDMAGKALTIDWLVENASSAFAPPLET